MPDEPNAIAPALSAAEWDKTQLAFGVEHHGQRLITSSDDPRALARVMALANAALPDDDPRKITHDDVVSLYETADAIERAIGSKMIGPSRSRSE